MRKAEITDKSALLALEQKVVAAERPYNISIKAEGAKYYDIDNLLTSEQSYLVVAEQYNKIIATGYVQIRDSKKSLIHNRHGYLGFMFVESDYRGLGLNKKLIDNLIAWAQAKGISDFYLDVYQHNAAAINAYEKVGFVKSMVEMKLS
jgi:ribosomal protein S18 acetylase RimI-like enzyme